MQKDLHDLQIQIGRLQVSIGQASGIHVILHQASGILVILNQASVTVLDTYRTLDICVIQLPDKALRAESKEANAQLS